jgi:hypothetical protein
VGVLHDGGLGVVGALQGGKRMHQFWNAASGLALALLCTEQSEVFVRGLDTRAQRHTTGL